MFICGHSQAQHAETRVLQTASFQEEADTAFCPRSEAAHSKADVQTPSYNTQKV